MFKPCPRSFCFWCSAENIAINKYYCQLKTKLHYNGTVISKGLSFRNLSYNSTFDKGFVCCIFLVTNYFPRCPVCIRINTGLTIPTIVSKYIPLNITTVLSSYTRTAQSTSHISLYIYMIFLSLEKRFFF